ncbi:hypothetical protein FHR84_002590 [Actinopolyspora biskrensis]|uniref:Uncharacterized protein n=1 Tax=Actinopolyspora biskrensis TaxID=1470178 RepID=A0A852Z6R0_9ACTN|nr:hypothetical protein [Actinopolyspora biskrensis]NYH79256.1 hypothetical protein [Actinopolyspora biskrensis]
MSTRHGELATFLVHEQWRLEQLAYDIAGHRCTARQCAETAAAVERVSAVLRDYAASLPFERFAEEPGSSTVVEGGSDG